ncbi:MAG: hypothetical protein IJV00_10355 [Clostridia bacterium]|nr:hypothetical protein [Clostridia bacterium]
MKKRLFALFAALALMIPFAACSAEKPSGSAPETVQPATSSPAPVKEVDEWGRDPVASAIPEDKHFDGETVNFFLDGSRDSEFFVDALSGDLINDAVYNRNLAIEDRLKVRLNFVKLSTISGEFAAEISRMVLSGSGDCDLLAGYANGVPAVVRNWCYADLRELENESCMDLSKPWWNQFYVNECTVNGHLYTITGDLAISATSGAICIFFNRRLADEHLSAWGGSEGLYRLAETYQWTIDEFINICKDVYNDADGDGRRSEGDFYAFSSWWSGPIPINAFQYGLDARITRNGEDGLPYLDYNSPHAAQALEKLWSLNNDCAGVLYNSAYYNQQDAWDMIMNKFINGTLIFGAYTLSTANTFGDMKDDFGILPMPMFDREQKAYYTSQSDSYSAFAVAADVFDRERADLVGTVFEMLNEESYRSVTPNYFETVMKYRYLRTDADNKKDIAMYDLILEGSNFNFGLVYSAMTDDIGFGWRHLIGRDNSKNLASYWNAKEAAVTNKFKGLLADLCDE